MNRHAPLIVCLPCLLLLSGCWNGRALLLFEQPYWSTLGGETVLKAGLAGGALLKGFFPRIVVVPVQERPVDRLLREAPAVRRGAVVVGPLLSSEWQSYAGRFPGIRFVLIGDVAADGLPPNVVVLSFDRVDAFRSAGREAAAAATAAGGIAGALVSGASDVSDAELAAFRDGVGPMPDGSAALLRVLPQAPDKAAVQDAIAELRRGGVFVILLGLGALDPWALEVMRTAGGAAVVAGWSAFGTDRAQVLLSIEEDVPRGVAEALAAAARGGRSALGPVRIVAGGSKKI